MGLTREERDERNARIVELHNRGRSMWDIGKLFGISGVAVSKILKGVRERWQATQLGNYDEYVLQRREEYRYVREQAMRGWFRSMKDAERVVEELGVQASEDGAASEADALTLLKRTTTREGQSGNNAFLATVLKAYRDEAELLGFVKNTTINNTNTNVVAPALQEALDALGNQAVPDPVAERLAQAAELPDRAGGV